MNTETLYYCDPEKNTECKKTYCLYRMGEGECYACRNPKVARDGLPCFKVALDEGGNSFIRERVT